MIAFGRFSCQTFYRLKLEGEWKAVKLIDNHLTALNASFTEKDFTENVLKCQNLDSLRSNRNSKMVF